MVVHPAMRVAIIINAILHVMIKSTRNAAVPARYELRGYILVIMMLTCLSKNFRYLFDTRFFSFF